MLLGIFWQVDLRRPFLSLISATDANTSFGFGASVAQVTSAFARRVARVSEKQGDFVVLDGGFLLGQSVLSDWGKRIALTSACMSLCMC